MRGRADTPRSPSRFDRLLSPTTAGDQPYRGLVEPPNVRLADQRGLTELGVRLSWWSHREQPCPTRGHLDVLPRDQEQVRWEVPLAHVLLRSIISVADDLEKISCRGLRTAQHPPASPIGRAVERRAVADDLAAEGSADQECRVGVPMVSSTRLRWSTHTHPVDGKEDVESTSSVTVLVHLPSLSPLLLSAHIRGARRL